MKNKYIKYFLMMVLTGFVFSCGDEIKKENESGKTVAVKTEKIKRIKFTKPITVSGKIYSSNESKLSFKTGGIIDKIFVDEGQIVKKNQILAKLDLKEINAKVVQAKNAFEKSKRDFERVENLYREKVATLEQKQNAETALKIAQENYEIAKFNLKYSSIKAPENGTVLKKFAEVNEIVGAGYPVILFGEKSKKWKLRVGVSDVELVKLKPGNKSEIKFDAYPSENFSGIISEIGKSASNVNGTFEVEISIEDPSDKLVSGFVAKAKIFPEAIENSVIIPVEALVEADELEAFIFLTKNNSSVVKRRIEILEILNSEVVVKNRLDGFSDIITSGAEYLNNKSTITVTNEK